MDIFETMRSRWRYGLILAPMFFIAEVFAQQTVQFTQYAFNGLAVNPAYSGYRDDWTASLSYRMQWTGLPGSPQTATASIDGTVGGSKNVGLGFILTNDLIGPQDVSSAYINYAYRIRLDETDTRRLSFGLAAGAVQYRLDVSKFSATNISDSAIPGSNQNVFQPDIRAGLYYYSPSFYIGASVLNILSVAGYSSQYTIVKQEPHFYFTAGAMIPLSRIFDLKPSVLVKEDFKGPVNIDLNAFLVVNRRIWLGASYRTGAAGFRSNLEQSLKSSDAAAVLLQVYCNDHFRIGYSYDFTTSKLAEYQNGTHEISVSFGIRGKKERILSPRYF